MRDPVCSNASVTGSASFSFVASVGSGDLSDIALDDVSIQCLRTPQPPTLPPLDPPDERVKLEPQNEQVIDGNRRSRETVLSASATLY